MSCAKVNLCQNGCAVSQIITGMMNMCEWDMSVLAAHTQRIHHGFARARQEMGLLTKGAKYAWLARLPCKPLLLTGSNNIHAIADAVVASFVQMDVLHWFELQEIILGHEAT